MTAYPCSWYSIFVLIKQHLRFKKGLIDYYANEKNNYCGCFSLDLLQRAYQDKLLELMSQEMERLNGKKGEPATIDDASFEQYKESINKTTLQAAKLIVKYNKKSTEEIHDKLDQLLDETKTS